MVEEVENVKVNKNIQKEENRTLTWFFIVVGLVFAAILVPYFWVESNKTFEFGHIDWIIEDYEGLEIFHGRFLSLTNPNLYYNVFFRVDPRLNEREAIGDFSSFKYGGVISLDSEVNECRGELSRVMLDLGAFLKQGIGIGPVESAYSDEEVANSSGKRFATCENVPDRTVVVIKIGEGGIIQDEENPNCYVIYARDCEDSEVVEKFMLKAIGDFRAEYPVEMVTG